jgi:hypothetical protein
VVLINSVLSSIPMFTLSLFEIPRGVLKKIEYYISRFFLQNDNHKKNTSSMVSFIPILEQMVF